MNHLISERKPQTLPLTALRSFEALSRHLNIEAAAEELNVTGSAIQHQIKSLEVFLGQKLIVRNKNDCVLTQNGQALFISANKALTIIRRALFEIQMMDNSGSLNILINKCASHTFITERLNGYISENPKILVNVSIGQEYDSESLSNYSLIFSNSSLESHLYRSVVIYQENLVPFCRPDYLKNLNLERASKMPVRLLTVDGKDDERDAMMAGLKAEGIERFNIVSFVSRRDAAKAALDGIGVAMLDPALVEAEIIESLLKEINLAGLSVEKPYVLSVKKTSESEPHIRLLLRKFGITPN